MDTRKPNTRPKSSPVTQGSARLSKRAASAQAIATVISSLPKVDPLVIPSAVDRLMGAADSYMASLPLVDTKGRRSKPILAEARASIAALHKHLSKAEEQLSNLPLHAITAIAQVTDAPIGKLRSDIAQISHTVTQVKVELADRPNKVTDTARSILAYEVAVVFRDILKLKPTSTSDKQLTPNMSTARGGAAFARVLRATLQAAGVVNYDPGPLITAGLGLLKDPNLPSKN